MSKLTRGHHAKPRDSVSPTICLECGAAVVLVTSHPPKAKDHRQVTWWRHHQASHPPKKRERKRLPAELSYGHMPVPKSKKNRYCAVCGRLLKQMQFKTGGRYWRHTPQPYGKGKRRADRSPAHTGGAIAASGEGG